MITLLVLVPTGRTFLMDITRIYSMETPTKNYSRSIIGNILTNNIVANESIIVEAMISHEW